MEMAPPPLTEVRPGVPAGLAAQVMRALEKRPEDRFQSAGEWLDALLDDQGRDDAAKQTAAPGTETFENRATIPVLTPTATPTATPTELYVPSGQTAAPTPAPAPTPVMAVPSSSGVTMQVPSARPSPSRFTFIASGGLLMAAVIAAGIYFLRPVDGSVEQTAAPVSVGAPAAAAPLQSTPQAVVDTAENPQLKSAREAEQQERYTDAIRLYDEYLPANQSAPDYPAVRNHLAEVKKFNGHLAIARTFMDKGDFGEARKDYAEALKLRPDSKLARDGLAAAEARLPPPQ